MKMLRACWQAFAAKEMEESISLLRDGLKRAVQPGLVLLKSQLVWGLPPRIFILPPVFGGSDDKCKKVTNARRLKISFPVLIVCLGDFEASTESCTYHLSITLNLLKKSEPHNGQSIMSLQSGASPGRQFPFIFQTSKQNSAFLFLKVYRLKDTATCSWFFYVHTLL